ncbi:MAG: septum formation initiator family protein [Candidatus Gastranaerophilales bacterium]|nr:septum formation initiator family protein [Candidatus Gastranaerophilales bacterium]
MQSDEYNNQFQNNDTPSGKDQKAKRKKIRWSMLSLVLFICIIELSVSAYQNISKNINFISKIKGLENKKNEELNKNQQLKFDIENYSSETTLESIARNNLKMAGKDEVLIIISKPKEDVQNVNVNHYKKREFDHLR